MHVGPSVSGLPDFQYQLNRTQTETHTELFVDYSDELLNFASVACITFIVVGVPGNVLTIVALIRSKQSLNSTAIFIINLSFSDLLFDCFNLPLAASTFLKRAWTHSDLLCRLFPLLRYGLLAVSLLTVSLITINRYIIVGYPRLYPRIYQHRYIALMVASTWIASFSIMIPTWRGIWGKFGLDISLGSCSILHDENGHSPKEFLFVVAFMFPCLCIVLCYARIFYLVRRAAFRSREPVMKNISFRTDGDQSPLEEKPKPMQNVLVKDKLTPKEETMVRPFFIDEDIEYIDVSDINDDMPISYNISPAKESKSISMPTTPTVPTQIPPPKSPSVERVPTGHRPNPITTSIKTSFTRFNSRKTHYVSMGNSNASSIYKMSQKDRRLLKMILVIFISFVICYLPITITKIWKDLGTKNHIVNISSYLLIYLTTCINPIIYVILSKEYRQAYWNLLRCQKDNRRGRAKTNFNHTPKT